MAAKKKTAKKTGKKKRRKKKRAPFTTSKGIPWPHERKPLIIVIK